MYMMVTGTMPFEGTNPLDCWMKKIRNDFVPPRELVPEISERTNWAILRAMSADPDKRPANCREFVEDLLGQSTKPTSAPASGSEQVDLWYLVYRDEDGQPHTVKGSTENIRRALQDHLLGDAGNITAARVKAGPFTPLNSFPEFRDLVVQAAPLQKPAAPTRTPAAPTAEAPALKRPMPPIAKPSPARKVIRDGPSQDEFVARRTPTSDGLPYLPMPPKQNSGTAEMIAWTLFAALIGGGVMWLCLNYFLK
jgi:hypothetical protein